jgi:SAM-dependent methyltransferase
LRTVTAEPEVLVPGLAERSRPVLSVVGCVSRVAPSARPRLQKSLIRAGYQVLNRRLATVEALCLNYGYAPPADSAWLPRSDVSLLPDRFGLQLYDRVAGGAPLEGRDVLEVGCGRGGGAEYVSRVFGTRAMTGIDFSAQAVACCRRRHHQTGLSFRKGDAEALPFSGPAFDAVLNVESSHCYPSVERFLDETIRVLRPGGVLLMADLRPANQVDQLRGQLASRFDVEDEEDITADVVRALILDAPRRERAVDTGVPRFLRPAVRDFCATPGSDVFSCLSSGALRYLRFAVRTAGPSPRGVVGRRP